MSSQRGSSLVVSAAICFMPAVLLLIATPSTASAQEGDPDRPMVVGIVPGPVAAVDMFLKIDGIDGEASDEAHSDWIDVLSVDWGARADPARPTTPAPQRRGGDGARRPTRMEIGNVVLTKSYDASSPSLALACAKGTHIPSLVLELTSSEADGSRYVRYELQDVIISSYSIDATGDRPTESVTFNFAKVEWQYIEQDQRGKLDSGWKVEKGEVDR